MAETRIQPDENAFNIFDNVEIYCMVDDLAWLEYL